MLAPSIDVQILQCSKCGAKAAASCDCGVPYASALWLAAEAIKASPQKSDRAIAKEIGVSNVTVSKARKDATVNQLTVDKRVGLDGKVRRMPKSKPVLEIPTEEEAERSYQRTLYDQACQLLDSMADETRRKFFAYLKRKYHVNE